MDSLKMKPLGKHPEKALTATKVKQVKKPGAYADGNGLYLVVSRTGAKRWALRTVIQGKRRDMGLGGAQLVSLAEAREKAQQYRKIAREGGDPFLERNKRQKGIPTFKNAAQTVFDARKATWRNPKHRQQWINTLTTYAFPEIGGQPVDQITTPDILKLLSPIWLTKPETARRLKQRIATVFDWAKAAGFRDGGNPVEGVTKGLPKQGKNDNHHAAMAYVDIDGFVNGLRGSNALNVTYLALEFTILTASRTSEVLNSKWSEFDIGESLWTIPPERMKATRVHRVPLSSRALEILKTMREYPSNGGYVFPGRVNGKPLSNMTLLKVLKSKKLPFTVHGFRSSFRDWAEEHSGFSHNVCEMALAHSIKDKTEAAYRRGDLLDKRRELMTAWGDFISTGLEGTP